MTPREQTIVLAATPQINEDEGFQARAYLDTRGVPTWGFGDTKHDVALGRSCTIEQARAWRDDYLADLAAVLAGSSPSSVAIDRDATLAAIGQPGATS